MMNDNKYTSERMFLNEDGTLEPWSKLSLEIQAEIVEKMFMELSILRDERNYLRKLLLSNGGRTASEIAELIQ